MAEQYIGTTACDECGARFKVSVKHKDRLGKPVRCSKCKSIFTPELIEPTPLETALMENAEQEAASEVEEKKKRRRTKFEIRQDTIEHIQKEFKKLHPRLAEIAGRRSSEEEIRVWCRDALVHALGYDSKENIRLEHRTLGKSADIVLHENDKVFLVIECKNTKSNLGPNVIDQAAGYAIGLGTEWAVTTNGLIWKLYRVITQKGSGPRFIEVFDVALLDEDGVSEEDAENLYLLSPRAVFGGDLEKRSHERACTNKKRVLKALESERVLKALRIELQNTYKAEHDYAVKLDDESVGYYLEDALGLSEL
ncbi:type I restriction enzyme HsdR N-terminal domain-containing protein [Leptolyngbya iicbica]|uniref:Type IV restriction endonuclease n=2 Tax=Cyanophyceae TaxID=3028117 RepID=A0A4Q7E9I0_9CYAN|nr:type I restriction enzyme HsdR N-terminal domain-containing protein [Leptolyngbya sp. LK]RZM79228.1 type IV restriction endonuclease [Leptolyngbya sp. LK]